MCTQNGTAVLKGLILPTISSSCSWYTLCSRLVLRTRYIVVAPVIFVFKLLLLFLGRWDGPIFLPSALSLSLSLSRYPVEFDDTYVQRVRCAVGKDENCCATLGKQGTPRLLISDRFLADVGILQGVYMWE